MFNTNQIIGQSLLVQKLEKILSGGRIVHAYLFIGPEGSGKKTFSSLMAHTLICQGNEDKPCHACHACRQYLSGNHPDVTWISPENGKTGIGIDQIREMQRDINVKPYQGSKKIYFIDKAHTMKEHAQNALLKTLEEPPPYALILLLADNKSSLLSTIQSRCQSIRIGSMARIELAQLVRGRLSISEEEALAYAGLSQGIPGKALMLALSEDFKRIRYEMIEKIAEVDNVGLLGLLESFSDNKEISEELFDILTLWYRDILILKLMGNTSLIINMDKFSLLHKQTEVFTIHALKDIIELIERRRKIIRRNGNYQLAIENMLIGLQEGVVKCSS